MGSKVEGIEWAAQMLRVSAEILVIIERETEARGIKPTPENISVVINLISQSLPSDLA